LTPAPNRWWWLFGALLALHLIGAAHVVVGTDWSHMNFTTGDNLRYREIAHAHGIAYRDVDVEFPPLSWAAVKIIGAGSSPSASGRALVALQLACDVAVASALAWAWSKRAAIAWLVLLVPFLWDGWIFARIDLLSVALAVGGLTLARRGAARTGGAVVGAAVLAKLWPAAVAPGLLIERRRTALWWAAAITAVGGLLWWIVGGTAGLRQVTTFRGAKGWQVESTLGSVLHLLGNSNFRGEAGAARIGTQPGWSRPLLAAAVVAAVAAIWWLAARAARHQRDDQSVAVIAALASVAAVAAVLVLAPIISPQYVVWMLPFAAIAVSDRLLLAFAGIVVVLTALVADNYSGFLKGQVVWTLALVLRNASIAALVIVGAVRLARAGARQRRPVTVPLRVGRRGPARPAPAASASSGSRART
jgi:hypothetical protein